jgi:hypothetical protein
MTLMVTYLEPSQHSMPAMQNPTLGMLSNENKKTRTRRVFSVFCKDPDQSAMKEEKLKTE